MAAKKTTPQELGEMLGYVVKHMATKDDTKDVKTDIARLDKSMARLSEQITGIEREIEIDPP